MLVFIVLCLLGSQQAFGDPSRDGGSGDGGSSNKLTPELEYVSVSIVKSANSTEKTFNSVTKKEIEDVQKLEDQLLKIGEDVFHQTLNKIKEPVEKTGNDDSASGKTPQNRGRFGHVQEIIPLQPFEATDRETTPETDTMAETNDTMVETDTRTETDTMVETDTNDTMVETDTMAETNDTMAETTDTMVETNDTLVGAVEKVAERVDRIGNKPAIALKTESETKQRKHRHHRRAVEHEDVPKHPGKRHLKVNFPKNIDVPFNGSKDVTIDLSVKVDEENDVKNDESGDLQLDNEDEAHAGNKTSLWDFTFGHRRRNDTADAETKKNPFEGIICLLEVILIGGIFFFAGAAIIKRFPSGSQRVYSGHHESGSSGERRSLLDSNASYHHVSPSYPAHGTANGGAATDQASMKTSYKTQKFPFPTAHQGSGCPSAPPQPHVFHHHHAAPHAPSFGRSIATVTPTTAMYPTNLVDIESPPAPRMDATALCMTPMLRPGLGVAYALAAGRGGGRHDAATHNGVATVGTTQILIGGVMQ